MEIVRPVSSIGLLLFVVFCCMFFLCSVNGEKLLEIRKLLVRFYLVPNWLINMCFIGSVSFSVDWVCCFHFVLSVHLNVRLLIGRVPWNSHHSPTSVLPRTVSDFCSRRYLGHSSGYYCSSAGDAVKVCRRFFTGRKEMADGRKQNENRPPCARHTVLFSFSFGGMPKKEKKRNLWPQQTLVKKRPGCPVVDQ